MSYSRLQFALLAALSLCAPAQLMSQGGLDRMSPELRPLFEPGRYFEMSWAAIDPELEGTGGLLEPAGLGTGDLLESYDQWGFAFKTDLNECCSLGVILDQPWGVNTVYPTVATSGYSGTTAILESNALSAIFKRQLGHGISIYGGLRLQTLEARAAFPFGTSLGLAGPYNVVANRDEGVGFLTGMAYEVPKIKLRLATTYFSEIRTNHATTETVGATITNTSTPFTTPQAINIDFQSGVAHNTLFFGSVRWVDWSKFRVAPPTFTTGVGVPLVQYTEDWLTYTFGVGRKINESWALAMLIRYTPETDQELTTLGPIDGRHVYSIAPTYTFRNMKLTFGVSYIDLGRATNFAGTDFDDGNALAVGIRVGYSF